jgi:coiled-coil domain-containing protein 12
MNIDELSNVSVISSDEEMDINRIMPVEENLYTFPANLSNTQNYDETREIRFKNYIPNDKSFIIENITYFNTVAEIEKNFEKKVRKSVKEFVNLEKNPLNIVPKRNNIDLKKALNSKLEKLSLRTIKALNEIIGKNLLTSEEKAKNNKNQGLITENNTLEV